ncbi:2-oxo-4-hydroxy-4-carboxy-5-ureidoimidazoline decarboxylase [Methylobacterium sp. BTF04]|uniref:2-oxo-4-hydroxy-4-carboxy-5-ureidoimidazoline decarboxylase n=1 Tax=Methylobacterium sp. BTF04 TaxID=2708300 RepID=UPI0013D138EA|nr:2-oxo-4-hydroxy-4-carboxy-5-ureidoimidazoline decarboxylase [Methylobacterium sp. BTF04]NEU10604.1 2-oxo-4-hydroxy-4-carboxy-5-ureidoimidazoline decarboxylase [Methylobacterium sp. BTF04]
MGPALLVSGALWLAAATLAPLPGTGPALVRVGAETGILALDTVNRMDREAFVAAFGGIFENSPWVAERAFAARPYASRDALHAAMMAVVVSATDSEKRAFLNAHPELAGQAARSQRMTTHSVSEQGSAGLDRMSDAEFDRFDRLNAAYRARFGFPFIIAVRGRSRAAIVADFERRLDNAPAAEMAAALAEIGAITRMRLERKLGPFE